MKKTVRMLLIAFLAIVLALAAVSCGNDPIGTETGPKFPAEYGKLELDTAAKTGALRLRYDDRFVFPDGVTDVKVESSEITSSKAGNLSEKDESILTFDTHTEKYVATATGSATLSLVKNGQTYKVEFLSEPAPISLYMVTGHSCGSGSKGNPVKSPVIEDGMAYTSFEGSGSLENGVQNKNLSNLSKIDANKAGIGYGAETAPSLIDEFYEANGGVCGIDAAFASNWIKATGEKIWIVNTAVGGSSLIDWTPAAKVYATAGRQCYDYAVKAFKNAETILKNEVSAKHYTLSHMGIINFTTANGDQTLDVPDYVNRFNAMWNGFKKEFECDINGDGVTETVESIGLITFCKICDMGYTGGWLANPLELNNGKIVNAYMASSDEYPDVYLAADDYRIWSVDDASVKEYFKDKDLSYKIHFGAITRPETRKDVYSDGVHYQQVGYNEMGFEAADNTLAFIGKVPSESVKVLDIDGKTEVTALTVRKLKTARIAVVSGSAYGNLTYETTPGISFQNGVITGKSTGVGENYLYVKCGDKTLATVEVTVTD